MPCILLETHGLKLELKKKKKTKNKTNKQKKKAETTESLNTHWEIF
jgi:hypothetical protein